MSKFAGKTLAELRNMEYDLELEAQHYESQEEIHCNQGDPEDVAYYAALHDSIAREREDIRDAQDIIEKADQAVYELEIAA
jgi:hypothetical protein